MGKVLTPEAEAERDQFEIAYEWDGNCSCHISPPCGSCTHPGNPRNQDEYEDCWMDEPEPLPMNTRILVSRNNREGWYFGKKRTMKGQAIGWHIPKRHCRVGRAEYRLHRPPLIEFDGGFGLIEGFTFITSPYLAP